MKDKNKHLQQHGKFKEAAHYIGDFRQLQEDTLKMSEEFACAVYGSKEKSMSQLRGKIFTKKCRNEKKIVDLSVLQPCQIVLKLYCKRSNYAAKIWRNSCKCSFQLPNVIEHKRTIDGETKYIAYVFQNWYKTFCSTLIIAIDLKNMLSRWKEAMKFRVKQVLLRFQIM